MNKDHYKNIKKQILQSKKCFHFLCTNPINKRNCSDCYNTIKTDWTFSAENSFLEREVVAANKVIVIKNNTLYFPIRCGYAQANIAIIKLPLNGLSIQEQLNLFGGKMQLTDKDYNQIKTFILSSKEVRSGQFICTNPLSKISCSGCISSIFQDWGFIKDESWLTEASKRDGVFPVLKNNNLYYSARCYKAEGGLAIIIFPVPNYSL